MLKRATLVGKRRVVHPMQVFSIGLMITSEMGIPEIEQSIPSQKLIGKGRRGARCEGKSRRSAGDSPKTGGTQVT